MEIFAYVATAFIGLSLGMLGGGGAVLTVPVLVYLFNVDPLLATSYSLFIVGSTSLTGAVLNYFKGLIRFRIALTFGMSSILTVLIIRKFVVPLLADISFSIGNFELSGNNLTLLLFAILMVVSAVSMIRKSKIDLREKSQKDNYGLLLSYGISIGIVTGLLGAGGGFLLIPALVLLLRLPMKEAVGTSLLIISLNSLVGFAGDLSHFEIDWGLLLKVTAIAITGIFAGSYFGKRLDGEKLKQGFGWFILCMGFLIIINELFLKS